MPDPGTITRAVNAVGVRSVDAVFPRIYDELRKLAAGHLAQERRAGGALEPTVLVHAAYEKLFAHGNPGWENRRHFFGAAANAMRQILIDEARKRRTERGARLVPHPATALVFGFSAWGLDELLALDEALEVLDRMDPRLSEIVRLRVFADLPMAQIAEVTGLSVRQANRDWRAAKAWLYRRIQGDGRGDEGGGDGGTPGPERAPSGRGAPRGR